MVVVQCMGVVWCMVVVWLSDERVTGTLKSRLNDGGVGRLMEG